MGKSFTRPLLLSHVQSPGKGASLVVTSAVSSGAAGAAGAAGACATTGCAACAAGAALPLAASAAVRSAFASFSALAASPRAFSSASSCAMRAFISPSSLRISSFEVDELLDPAAGAAEVPVLEFAAGACAAGVCAPVARVIVIAAPATVLSRQLILLFIALFLTGIHFVLFLARRAWAKVIRQKKP